jgi:hypothetical protein
MYDPLTKGVHVSRDVSWLRRMFFPPPKIEAGEGLSPSVDVVEMPVDDPPENAIAMATAKEDEDADDGSHYEDGQEEQGLEEGKEDRHETEAAEEAVKNLTTTRSGRVVRVPHISAKTMRRPMCR